MITSEVIFQKTENTTTDTTIAVYLPSFDFVKSFVKH